ncbi:hypothetical protein D3C71_1835750 [compost metagenome]
MRRADRHCEAVDAGQFDKAFRFLRVRQKCALCVHAHVVFHTAQPSQLCLDAAIIEMAEIHHRFHQLHVLLKRVMTAVNHRAAHARMDLATNIVQ